MDLSPLHRMPAPEGIALRKGFVYAGVAMLVVGIVIFAACSFAVSQAATDFMNCVGTNPYAGTPPSACLTAMGNMFVYGMLEWVGIFVGVVGFVVLLVGLLVPPEHPTFAPPPYYPSQYPPQYYAPPPAYPPQGPQTPPPQP